jgi:hypothetical protein
VLACPIELVLIALVLTVRTSLRFVFFRSLCPFVPFPTSLLYPSRPTSRRPSAATASNLTTGLPPPSPLRVSSSPFLLWLPLFPHLFSSTPLLLC